MEQLIGCGNVMIIDIEGHSNIQYRLYQLLKMGPISSKGFLNIDFLTNHCKVITIYRDTCHCCYEHVCLPMRFSIESLEQINTVTTLVQLELSCCHV